MKNRTRTVDLAAESSPSSYIGQRAVWTDFEGREHVGVLAADPMGTPWPVVDFGDGTYGRTGGTVEVVEDGPPCLAKFDDEPTTYTCTLDRDHHGDHAAVDQHDGEVLHTWHQRLAPKVAERAVTLLAVELLNNGHRLDSYGLHCIAQALGTTLSDVVRTAELIRANTGGAR